MFLPNTIRLFEYYKSLGEKSFDQLTEEQLFDQGSDAENSIAIIVKHLHGNMMSRWTDFLTTDGEKEWRQRDDEFVLPHGSRAQMLALWEEGWKCLFDTLDQLEEVDLDRTVYIRNMGHSVIDAIMRQVAHYSYHVGQIVLLAKQMKGDNWVSLSIPKGASKAYNDDKFAKEQSKKHFTDDL